MNSSKPRIERHLNSKHEHVLDGDTCWCRPQVEKHETLVVIHNDIAPPDPPDGA